MLTNLVIAAFAQAVIATPPPPPAPSCDPFMIFFDSGSAAIPTQYEQTINNIVAVREMLKSHIKVEGHADASGSSSYNLKLSRRRAESVKAALIAKGFAKHRIVTSARGESAALLETQDSTSDRERRVVTVCFY